MSKARDRTVYQRSDGKWANKRNDSGRASTLHDRQSSAEKKLVSLLQCSQELAHGPFRKQFAVPNVATKNGLTIFASYC